MSVADLIPYVILACCVLHNLCLEECNDDIDDFIEEERQYNERNNNKQNKSQESIECNEENICNEINLIYYFE